jgi:hypothetical protein
METRVLALARRFDLPSERALTILRDPDAAYAVGEPLPMPFPDAPGLTPIYTIRARAAFCEQISWIGLLLPPATLALIAALASRVFGWYSAIPLWTVLAAPPFVFWLLFRAELGFSQWFAARIRRQLAARLQPPEHALFVGIHPGKGVRYTDSLSEWDFGFLTFGGDWLTYRGEATGFSIPRHNIASVEVVSGPPTWWRDHRVQIVLEDGQAFVINPDFGGERKKHVRRLAEFLQLWMYEPLGDIPAQPQPLPAPSLPTVPGLEVPRSSAILSMLLSSALVFLGSLIFLLRSRPGDSAGGIPDPIPDSPDHGRPGNPESHLAVTPSPGGTSVNARATVGRQRRLTDSLAHSRCCRTLQLAPHLPPMPLIIRPIPGIMIPVNQHPSRIRPHARNPRVR